MKIVWIVGNFYLNVGTGHITHIYERGTYVEIHFVGGGFTEVSGSPQDIILNINEGASQ